MLFYISNPLHDTYGNEKDKIGFYLNNNEYYENNSISYNKFDVKHKVELELTTHNENSTEWNKDLSTGDEIDISTTVKRSDLALGKPLNDTPRNVVVNPTYYFKIPRYLSYVENSFNINSVQKKPKVSILPSESLDEYYLKVEFYGDLDSETGWNQSYIDVKFKLKVENYAPRDRIDVSIETYEDISNTLKLYNQYIEKNQWMMVRVKEKSWSESDGTYVDGKYFIYAGDKLIEVVKSKNMPKISGIVLHSPGTMILQSVSGGTNALPKNNTQIKSGELYNSYIDIINNSGELEDFTMYIPVPRTDRVDEYGRYRWDAKLIEVVSHNSSDINVQYSTDVNATKNKWKNGTEDANGMYIDANEITDPSKITMIKISAAKIDALKNVSIYAKFSNLRYKDVSGELLSEIYGYYSYKLQGSSNYTTSQSPAVTVTLKDTIISGYLFEDNNSDGLKNNGDTVLANKEVTLYDGEGHVDGQARSDANGFYRFTVPSIPENGYLMIEKIPGYSYTINKNEENPTSIVSSFDPKTEKAYPTLSNSEKQNAGFIKTPDITLKSDSLTVRVNKTGTIVYDLLPPDMSKDIKFESADNSIATVDDKGVVTGLTVGETNVRVYYETITGIKIYKDVRIIVITNDPSVFIQIPKYIELKDDGTGDIKASPEVRLYSGSGKDGHKINVPKVNIYVDSSVVLQKGTDEFTAQTYKKDNQPYTNPALPILQLESGKLEEDSFYLKANKKTIPKNIGVYQGLLNFTMEFEGD